MEEKARLLAEETARNDQERQQQLDEATELAAKTASEHAKHMESMKMEMLTAMIDAAEKERVA